MLFQLGVLGRGQLAVQVGADPLQIGLMFHALHRPFVGKFYLFVSLDASQGEKFPLWRK